MKFAHILNELGNTNPETFEKTEGRRSILKSFGSKLALAAVPLAASSVFNKAQAKTTDILAEAIVFALGISYMQAAYIREGLAATGLIPADAKGDFQKMLDQKDKHIAYWIYYLTKTNNTVPTVPTYDFTAKNALPDVFTNYATYLTLAHALEDVGVRMYQTSIKNLLTNKAFRSDAVNMMTTIARHAAHVRLLRRNLGGSDIMPWITGTNAYSIVGEIQKAYQGEDNTIQSKSNAEGVNGFAISFDAATAAFDEPMGVADANAFMSKFIKP